MPARLFPCGKSAVHIPRPAITQTCPFLIGISTSLCSSFISEINSLITSSNSAPNGTNEIRKWFLNFFRKS